MLVLLLLETWVNSASTDADLQASKYNNNNNNNNVLI